MRLRYLFGAFLTGGIAVLDLFIKRVIASSFHYGESIEVIPGFFALTYILNPGAAFGILADWDSWLRFPVLVIASIAALGFLGYLFSSMSRSTIASIALPLIAAGAVANLYERLTAGAVVDYLDFYISDYHWPAFNLADASITSGVVLLLIGSRFGRSGTELWLQNRTCAEQPRLEESNVDGLLPKRDFCQEIIPIGQFSTSKRVVGGNSHKKML